ncbi:MAG TPA: hypothetical protein VGP72_23645 [Planctomycetota bacterium]|jgi:hypothetical protein
MKLRIPFRSLLAWPLLVAGLSVLSRAGEPAHEKPWRLFPDVPEILLYEGFENEPFIFKPDKNNGKLVADAPCAPGGHAWALANTDRDKNKDKGEKRWVMSKAELGNWRAKFPAGLDPAGITVQVFVYTDQPGYAALKCRHGSGEYEDQQSVNIVKQWTPVLFKFTEMRGNKNRPEAKQTISEMEFWFQGKPRGEYPVVLIDDIVVAHGMAPAMVLAKLKQAEKKYVEIARSQTKEGFSYTLAMQDALKSATRSAGRPRKAKTILIAPARPADSAVLKTGMAAAAQKIKAGTYNVLPLSAPDGSPAGGLQDIYGLIPYNVQKTDAEVALLVLSCQDAVAPGRTTEHLKLVIERILDAGCIPVVCLPAATTPGVDKGKVEAFNNSCNTVLGAMNVPVIDTATALKDAKNVFEGSDLNAAGLEALAQTATTALRHIEINLFGRR